MEPNPQKRRTNELAASKTLKQKAGKIFVSSKTPKQYHHYHHMTIEKNCSNKKSAERRPPRKKVPNLEDRSDFYPNHTEKTFQKNKKTTLNNKRNIQKNPKEKDLSLPVLSLPVAGALRVCWPRATPPTSSVRSWGARESGGSSRLGEVEELMGVLWGLRYGCFFFFDGFFVHVVSRTDQGVGVVIVSSFCVEKWVLAVNFRSSVSEVLTGVALFVWIFFMMPLGWWKCLWGYDYRSGA